ncbi:hypothetical protein NLJ89_g956 [Agrocybe chaxingu]|uniref:Uncharacterized protein n=1 Tax=Agrocybe chaxingu TaxID=84603 RepID=A0A9W8N0X3_9AGAR|nr:hypothetical protein NLJ89_g956 [Agrocybe chaxingu]
MTDKFRWIQVARVLGRIFLRQAVKMQEATLGLCLCRSRYQCEPMLPLHHDYTVPLVDQVKQWSTYAADFISHLAGQTLAAWWTGINDTEDTVNSTAIVDFNAFWEHRMSSYFKAMKTATDRGLYAYLFVNVLPGERTPATVNNSTNAAILKVHVSLFNNVLSTFCKCADPAGFFWYDSVHPTKRVHRLLAEAVEAKLRAQDGLIISGPWGGHVQNQAGGYPSDSKNICLMIGHRRTAVNV